MSTTDNAAIEWVRTLALRGIEVRVRNNRVWLLPPTSYKTLSDEDLLFLRHHRNEIKVVVSYGEFVGEPVVPVAAAKTQRAPATKIEAQSVAAPAPAPVVCRYCGNRECVGEDHVLFRIFHLSDPLEIARQNREATDVMLATMRHGHNPIHIPGSTNRNTL